MRTAALNGPRQTLTVDFVLNLKTRRRQTKVGFASAALAQAIRIWRKRSNSVHAVRDLGPREYFTPQMNDDLGIALPVLTRREVAWDFQNLSPAPTQKCNFS
jgi:hypothetical protein